MQPLEPQMRKILTQAGLTFAVVAVVVLVISLALGATVLYAILISLFLGLVVGGGLGFLVSWRLDQDR